VFTTILGKFGWRIEVKRILPGAGAVILDNGEDVVYNKTYVDKRKKAGIRTEVEEGVEKRFEGMWIMFELWQVS